VWARTVNGLVLTFHLAGINNQNFLMRDEETGTFWQQISGRAISAALAGSQLEPVHSDELTFALWRKETPNGSVLKPLQKDSSEYETKDWDIRMAKARTVLNFPNSGLRSRDLVLGVNAFGASRAYPVERVFAAKLIEDRLGSEAILIMAGPDGKSIRVFQARAPGQRVAPEYYWTGDVLMDAETGSEWDFAGCAVRGSWAGTCLKPLDALKDYWFDWRNYHPETTIFRR
jgi:Protein of unknown function (DUF3179)